MSTARAEPEIWKHTEGAPAGQPQVDPHKAKAHETRVANMNKPQQPALPDTGQHHIRKPKQP